MVKMNTRIAYYNKLFTKGLFIIYLFDTLKIKNTQEKRREYMEK